jgi:SAM-dependent methyltransferase
MKTVIKACVKMLIPAGLRARFRVAFKRIGFFGFRYECPFCKSRLRAFLPFGPDLPVLKKKKVVGGGYRLNSLCPICGAFDRERLLYLYLLRKTDVFINPRKLLHVAPEERVRKILSSKTNLDYLTADLYSKNVGIEMDITDIQFSDNSFDAIICNHVLEHIVDDRKAMAELHRVLKPEGWAILQVPMSLTLDNTYENFSITTAKGREEAFGQHDHVRIYAMDYEARLASAGFKVNVFRWIAEAENFGGRKNIFGLNEDECVYVARK